MSNSSAQHINWKPLLLEAFFVVLGVVLAFAINEWREHRNQLEHARVALESIQHELVSNRQAVHASATYHLFLSDTLRSLTQSSAQRDQTLQRANRLFGKGYVSSATLLSTAWNAANATDAITHMPYADVLRLSSIYQEQRQYESQAEQAGHLIYTKLFNEGHAGMLRQYDGLAILISTFWYTECRLLQRYDEVLATLPTNDTSDHAELDPVPSMCERIQRR